MGFFGRIGRGRKIVEAGELRRSGDPAAAIEQLAPLLAQDPDDPAANVEMARSLQLLGEAAGAEDHYRRALLAKLDYALVVELAGTVGTQGRSEEAAAMLDAALLMTEEDPRLDAGEVHLMRAMLAAAEGRPTDAKAALQLLEGSSTAQHIRDYGRRLRDKLDAG